MRRLTAPREIRLAASLLFMVALVNVFALDHITGPVNEHSPEHALHCHSSPLTCGDQPLPAGPGQLIFNDPLIPAPPLASVLLRETTRPAPSPFTVEPLLPPPRV